MEGVWVLEKGLFFFSGSLECGIHSNSPLMRTTIAQNTHRNCGPGEPGAAAQHG